MLTACSTGQGFTVIVIVIIINEPKWIYVISLGTSYFLINKCLSKSISMSINSEFRREFRFRPLTFCENFIFDISEPRS